MPKRAGWTSAAGHRAPERAKGVGGTGGGGGGGGKTGGGGEGANGLEIDIGASHGSWVVFDFLGFAGNK